MVEGGPQKKINKIDHSLSPDNHRENRMNNEVEQLNTDESQYIVNHY